MVTTLSVTMISRLSLNLRAHKSEDILGQVDPNLDTGVHSAMQFRQTWTAGSVQASEAPGRLRIELGEVSQDTEIQEVERSSPGGIEVSETRWPKRSDRQ